MRRQSCIAGWSTIGHIVSRDYIPYWQDFGTKRGHFKTFFRNRKTKVTEELSAPPLLPNLGEISNEANKWYYVVNGARQGPTTATTIRDLLSKKEIETDTQVWRKGM